MRSGTLREVAHREFGLELPENVGAAQEVMMIPGLFSSISNASSSPHLAVDNLGAALSNAQETYALSEGT